jgi:probable rRNA maturation factor
MINVTIRSPFDRHFTENEVTAICQQILAYFELENVELTVILESDLFIQQLNLDYRGIDSPTDVLSFDIDHIDPETGRRYLGDIIISVDTAERQAEVHKVNLKDELTLLVVHGVLHLLGYDHSEEHEQKEMWEKQRVVLELLGTDPNFPIG